MGKICGRPLGFVMVVVAACGGSGSSGGVEDLGAAYCAKVEPCCAKAGLPSDGTTCNDLFTYLSSASSGSANSSAIAACISALQAEPQDQFCQDFGNMLSACSNALSVGGGKTAAGGSCDFDSDCATPSSGTAICFLSGSTSGTCVTEQTGVAGSTPCNATSTPFAGGASTIFAGSSATSSSGYLCSTTNGVYCDATTFTCAAVKSAGEACMNDYECATGSTCAFSTDGTGTSTCMAKAAIGAACTSDFTVCVDDAYCASDGTCAALLADGAACTDDTSCSSGSCTGSVCSSDGSELTVYCGMN